MADRSWAAEQMKAVGISPLVQSYVMDLFRVHDKWEYSDAEKNQAVELFTRLRKDVALDRPAERNEVWQAGRPGRFVVRNEVRVKADAYKGDIGEIHNGRRGVVIAIRHGDILVMYQDGRKPEIKDARHSPYVLEKRVQ